MHVLLCHSDGSDPAFLAFGFRRRIAEWRNPAGSLRSRDRDDQVTTVTSNA